MSILTQISEHVFWLSPDKPDRPSLCAIAGEKTLLVDAGASPAHARLFLEALAAARVPAPGYVVLTHWHWDHVFGAAHIGLPVIAHQDTARQLDILASYGWDDASLDRRVATGEEIASCARDIKQELPDPRSIEIVTPELVFYDTLDINLGGVSCHIEHVGGDHAADACIVTVAPDRVTILGDCLYDAIYTPVRHYTPEKLFPLLEKVLRCPADQFIEGHTDTVVSRAEMEAMASQMRHAAALVDWHGAEALSFLPQSAPANNDTADFVESFLNARQLQETR